MHISYKPKWNGRTIANVETHENPKGCITDIIVSFVGGGGAHVSGTNEPGYLACVTETPNDPSSPTAELNAKPTPEAESAVGCSGLLGDEETKLRNSMGQYMTAFIKRNLQPPQ
jgi:hypothetical protein